MTNQILYDDTYTGPRFTYGLTYRPLAQSQVPDDWIIWSNKEHKDFPFGTIDYPFEVAPEKVKSFQLIQIST